MRHIDLWVEDPASCYASRFVCSIDPLSAMVGGVLPALFGGSQGSGSAPAPQAPPPAAAPAKPPAPKQASQQGSSFIGGVPTPPPSAGGKTLLGQ